MVGLGILGRLGTRIALVDKREDDGIPCHLLYLGRQGADLAPILLVGGRDLGCQQMPQGIDGHMHLRTAAAFRPIIARPRAAFGRRLHGATIENRRRGVGLAPLCPPQHGTQIMHDGFKHTSLEPALTLLVHGIPGRQIMRHQPPCRTRPDYPAQAIEDLAQAVLPLRSGFSYEGQIGGD
jgi:hypothetical protein